MTKMFDVYSRILRNLSVNINTHYNSIFTQLLKEFGFILFYIIELYYTIKVTSFVQNEVYLVKFKLRQIINGFVLGQKNFSCFEIMQSTPL